MPEIGAPDPIRAAPSLGEGAGTRAGDAEGKLAAGRLGAPRGVRGDLRIQSYSGEFEHIFALKEAELARDGVKLRLRVLRSSLGPGGATMAFEGYSTPEAARRLTGMDILVPRSDAAPLKENEWYIADLVELSLVPVGGGEAFGRVASVVEGGAEPWLEALLSGGERVLVPFRKEFIGAIDLEAGTVELLSPWILE